MDIGASSATDSSKLRVAIVHYWFVVRIGGERAVEALGELLPQADPFSRVADRKTLEPASNQHFLLE